MYKQYQAVLPAVAEACFLVSESEGGGRLKGAQMIEALHERSHFGAPDVSDTMMMMVMWWAMSDGTAVLSAIHALTCSTVAVWAL